jgi:methionyl-tRNA formyltransferase
VEDVKALAEEIERHRRCVSRHFQTLIFAPAEPGADDRLVRALETLLEPELDDPRRLELLRKVRIGAADAVLAQLNVLRESTYYRRLDETGRRRLHTLLPSLLQAVAGSDTEAAALGRVLHVIERIGGRTVYLALLNENVVARERLVELCAQSQFLTDQIAAFPLLLDELLDERLFEATPTRAEFEQDLRARMAGAGADDPERQVDLLREFQRAAVFRVAVPDLTGRLPLMKVSDRLTDLAELIVAEALALSWQQIAGRHGVPRHGPDEASLADSGMVVVAYGLILPQTVLDTPRLGCWNVHASLLPRWRGAAPIQRAIAAGDTVSGVCLMQMEKGLDTGPVLLQLKTPIGPKDTGGSLHDRLSQLGAEVLRDGLTLARAGMTLQAEAQPEAGVSYARKIDKAEAKLEWSSSAKALADQIRAFNPWPVAETELQGERVRVYQAQTLAEDSGKPPGTVLAAGKAGIDIACGQGTLRLLALQRDGGRVQSASEYLNARPLAF